MNKYNFHTHTERCGHAFGEDEEYIEHAIKEGFKVLGFSDHAMFPFFDQPGIRGSYLSQYPDYLKSIKNLKEKYKDKIDIHIGLEGEYAAYFESFYIDLYRSKEIEYLVLGQHYHFPEGLQCLDFCRTENGAKYYTEDVKKGIRSGLFLYICHPDQLVYHIDKNDPDFVKYAKEIILEAKKYDIPLELNVSKVENGRLMNKSNYEERAPFPVPSFWEIAGKEQVKVVIGLDAHTPENVNEIGFNYALSLIKKYNLNVIDEVEILSRINKLRQKFIK